MAGKHLDHRRNTINKFDGTWYQIGELYEGTCTVEDYDSSNDAYEGAFDRLKPYCYIGNGAQEVKLRNADTLSRAYSDA